MIRGSFLAPLCNLANSSTVKISRFSWSFRPYEDYLNPKLFILAVNSKLYDMSNSLILGP